MSEIFKSAAKLVLLFLVLVIGLLALFTGIWSVIHGEFNEASKIILGLFGTAITLVLGFFFGYKGDTSKENAGK